MSKDACFTSAFRTYTNSSKILHTSFRLSTLYTSSSIIQMLACRICYEPDCLISVCHCTGSCAGVHFDCIQKWIMISKRKKCEICHHPYVYPGLCFPKTLDEVRLKNANVISFLFGVIHGISVWIDSNANLTYIWIYIISCFLFNMSLTAVLTSLYKSRIRFWKTILFFYMGFVAGNMPGHVFTEKMAWQVSVCYGLNVMCMCLFLTLEYFLSLEFREPPHQNNVIVYNPAHNQ